MIMATAFSESSVFIPQSSPQKTTQTKDTTITEKSVKTLVDGFSKSIDNLTRKLDSLGKVIDKLSENVKTNTNTVKDNTETNNTINKAKSKEASLAARQGYVDRDTRDAKTRNRDIKNYNSFINNRSKEVNNAINSILKDTTKETGAAISDELRNAITDYLVTNGETSLEDALSNVKGVNINDIARIKRIANNRRSKVKGLDRRSILSSAMYSDYDHLDENTRNKLLDHIDNVNKNKKEKEKLQEKYNKLNEEGKKAQKESFEQQMALLEKEGENLEQHGKNLEVENNLQDDYLKIIAEQTEQKIKDEREKIKGDVEEDEKKRHGGVRVHDAYSAGYALAQFSVTGMLKSILGLLSRFLPSLGTIGAAITGLGPMLLSVLPKAIGVGLAALVGKQMGDWVGETFEINQQNDADYEAIAKDTMAGSYNATSKKFFEENNIDVDSYQLSDDEQKEYNKLAKYVSKEKRGELLKAYKARKMEQNDPTLIIKKQEWKKKLEERRAEENRQREEAKKLKEQEAKSTEDMASIHKEDTSNTVTKELSYSYSGLPQKEAFEQQIRDILNNPNLSEEEKEKRVKVFMGSNLVQSSKYKPDLNNIIEQYKQDQEGKAKTGAVQQNNTTNQNITNNNINSESLPAKFRDQMAAGR